MKNDYFEDRKKILLKMAKPGRFIFLYYKAQNWTKNLHVMR